MRSKRRIALLLASAGALGVGLIAFPGSAAAVPPVVPTCTLPPSSGSQSCGSIRTNAAPPAGDTIGAQLEPIQLGVRVRSVFSSGSQKTTSVRLQLDEQISLNLAGIPTCPSSELTGKTIAAAWEQCGPGADTGPGDPGTPPNSGNAFLSTGLGANVSGIGSSVPDGAGAVACTLIFKGANNNTLTLMARTPVLNAASCNNPAAQTGGTTTILFTGALTTQPPSSIFHHTLFVNNTHLTPAALDDFYATLTRGNAVRARCATRTPSAHRMLATWDYLSNSPPDPNDNHVSVNACPH